MCAQTSTLPTRRYIEPLSKPLCPVYAGWGREGVDERVLVSDPALITFPISDSSMPYNVITLVSGLNRCVVLCVLCYVCCIVLCCVIWCCVVFVLFCVVFSCTTVFSLAQYCIMSCYPCSVVYLSQRL